MFCGHCRPRSSRFYCNGRSLIENAIGGSGADILDINLTGPTLAVASAVTGTSGGVNYTVASGIMTLTGTATEFDELSEVVAIAQLAAETAGETLGFEFGGSTYVFTQNAGHDILVQLTAVTGVAGLGLLAGTGDVGGANWVIIG